MSRKGRDRRLGYTVVNTKSYRLRIYKVTDTTGGTHIRGIPVPVASDEGRNRGLRDVSSRTLGPGPPYLTRDFPKSSKRRPVKGQGTVKTVTRIKES